MKQYVIDELRVSDFFALKTYLADRYGTSTMGGIYWIPIDEELLTDIQKAHVECRPHYVAVDLAENRISCELLVRTQHRMRCDCIGYASPAQRNWLIDLIDDIFHQLDILT